VTPPPRTGILRAPCAQDLRTTTFEFSVSARKRILATQRYCRPPGRLQTKLRQGRLNYVGADRAGKFCVADATVALPK